MKLWKRASGVLKDQNSLWITSLSRPTTLRNPDIEASVIKATNHDEFRIDYKNFHRVLSWLRLSDVHVKPAVRCISSSLQKTRSWIVAVKGLMLMHGIVSTRISVVQLIGRLPFDLSNFKDGHSKLGKILAHNAFIRSYYAFLDCKSSLLHRAMLKDNGEVLLSAGALGSPQLLLLSGIGPRAYLSAWEVPVVRDHPFVGQFLYDNPKNWISIVPSMPLEHSLIQVVGITSSGTYLEASSNVISFNTGTNGAFIRRSNYPVYFTVATLMEKIAGPLSAGSLKLASTECLVSFFFGLK